MILEQTNGPEELKALPPEGLKTLAQEIRIFLTEKISHTGGHLASNLDVVGLTIALFKTLSLPEDKVIWDVRHRSCTHKILNGRMAEFDELRQYGGLSEFPKRKESPYDSFDTSHSSTSISAGLGIALGCDIRGKDYRVVFVIGDGALTSGVAHEALNNTVRMKKSFIIVLNDSKMSISENVGGMSHYLNDPRTGSSCNDLKKSVADALDRIPVVGTAMMDKVKCARNNMKQLSMPGMLFENMGITYLGLVDGHNTQILCRVLREAQKLDHTVPVHVMTKKGKRYRPAEKDPSYFHGVGSFDMKTGQSLSSQKNPSYTDVFSRKFCRLGQEHPELVAAAAAMPDGTGPAALGKKFPDRSFNVGITEAHAVTFAVDMATAGLRPVVAVYSSFLQRAYDRVLHDIYIQNLPVLFAADQTGLVGSDGETHRGVFDYSFLTSVLDMSVMAPKSLWELRAMLDFTMDYNSPLVVRYPKDETYRGLKEFRQPISYGVGEIPYEEEDIALLVVDSIVSTGEHVRQKLKTGGYRHSFANGRFVKPFDRKIVSRLAKNHRLIVIMEENVLQGGYGLTVTVFIHENYLEAKVLNITIPDAYVEYGNVSILREGLGTDSDSIIRTMKADGYTGRKD